MKLFTYLVATVLILLVYLFAFIGEPVAITIAIGLNVIMVALVGYNWYTSIDLDIQFSKYDILPYPFSSRADIMMMVIPTVIVIGLLFGASSYYAGALWVGYLVINMSTVNRCNKYYMEMDDA